MSTSSRIYEAHHKASRAEGFSILREERGKCFASYIGTGKRVLDLGCRDGALTEVFMAGNSVVGVDIDEHALARARAHLGIETHVFDALGDWSELGGEQFDVIVAGEILEHLYFPEVVAQKVALHLKPGGLFIGSVPNAFHLKNRLRYLLAVTEHTPMADPTHITQFSLSRLRATLSLSFPVVTVRGIGQYARLAAWAPSLCAFDLLFVATKVSTAP